MAEAKITWVEEMQFIAVGDSGHAIVMDSAGSGARPMEILLEGVMGCTAMDVLSILKKKRQPIKGFKIFATAERAEEHPRFYTKIHLDYVAYGEVSLTALERAVQLSEEKYCSAMATVRGVAEITSSARVEPEA